MAEDSIRKELVAEPISSKPMFVLLVILVFVYNFCRGIYLARGLELLPEFDFLYTAAFLCGVVWWLGAEARRHAVWPVYCPGMLVQMGWVVIIPYHLIKTRGVRALIPLLALIGSFVTAHILAAIVYVILST